MQNKIHRLLRIQLENAKVDPNNLPEEILNAISDSYVAFEKQIEANSNNIQTIEREKDNSIIQLAKLKEKEFEDVLDRLPGYISWFDLDLRYIGVSKNLSNFYGKDPSFFVGKKVGEFTGNLTSVFTITILNFVNSDVSTCSFEHKIKNDKEEKDVIVYLQKIESDKMILAYGLDVTDKNRMQKEIDTKRAIEGHNNRIMSLGEMAAGIAHEINNPLAIIKGNTQLLRRSFNEVELEEHELKLNKISYAIERISKILSNLKLLSRSTEYDQPERTCIKTISESALELCEYKVRGKKICIKFDVQSPCYVSCVPTELIQVFHNLLNNAIDAVENHEDPWIEFRAIKQNDKIIITVTDSGNGISLEVKDKIWQPFFTTKESMKGTGLGLPICKSLIQKNKGNFYYDGEYKNTRFVIELEDFDLSNISVCA